MSEFIIPTTQTFLFKPEHSMTLSENLSNNRIFAVSDKFTGTIENIDEIESEMLPYAHQYDDDNLPEALNIYTLTHQDLTKAAPCFFAAFANSDDAVKTAIRDILQTRVSKLRFEVMAFPHAILIMREAPIINIDKDLLENGLRSYRTPPEQIKSSKIPNQYLFDTNLRLLIEDKLSNHQRLQIKSTIELFVKRRIEKAIPRIKNSIFWSNTKLIVNI